VNTALLTAIAITPTIDIAPQGKTAQFTATGTYSDDSTQYLSSQVTWSSTYQNIGTIDTNGIATAVASAGSTTISATIKNAAGTTLTSNNAIFSANAAVLESITVTPQGGYTSRPAGLTVAYDAIGHYSNNTESTITDSVTWSSGNNTIASISAAGVATINASSGTTQIIATKGLISSNTSLTALPPVVQMITVTPNSSTIAQYQSQPYTATAQMSSGPDTDITESATWSSSNAAVATISNTAGSRGVAYMVAQSGTSNIIASSTNTDGGVTVQGSTSVTATYGVLESVTICTSLTNCSATSTSITITAAAGSSHTANVYAQGHYANGMGGNVNVDVTNLLNSWTIGNTTIASVANRGTDLGYAIVTGDVAGTTTLQAIFSTVPYMTSNTMNVIVQ